MSLSWWRRLVQSLPTARQKAEAPRRRRLPRKYPWLRLEELEDRTLLSTFRWLGTGTASWSTPANWVETVNNNASTFPSAAGDIAQFTGTYATPQTATVDVTGVSVGEIDFGTAQ